MIKHKCFIAISILLLIGLVSPSIESNGVNITNKNISKIINPDDRLPAGGTIGPTNWWSLLPSERFSLGSFLNFDIGPSKPSVPLRCGQRFKSISNRIVGGRRTSIALFPWMVSLQREKGNWYGLKAFYHSCGGSLITRSWILTAAHCLYKRTEPLRTVMGTDNLNFVYRAQVREVISKQIIHPDFDITSYDNDIALIKVSQPFNLESSFNNVGTICLSRDFPIVPYDIATICGFGARAFHAKTRSHLYETQIAIIDRKTCNRSFEGAITNNMICAGGMIANRRDACSGDSGGPMAMENEDGRMVLAGVVSFGQDCARAHFPGIYANTQAFYDWIRGQIDEPLEQI